MTAPAPAIPARTTLVLRPWRSFAICSAVVFLAIMLLRDTAIALPIAADTDGGSPLMTRIAADTVRFAFAAACSVALLFTLLQTAMLILESAVLKRGVTTGVRAVPGQALRLFAARPLRLEQPQDRLSDARVAGYDGDALPDPLRLGLTAFPMLGFLGTVVGLSGAIEALPGAIGNPDALQPVLSQLHVAFDTTLLGLIGALICLLGTRLIELAVETLSRHVDQT